MTGVFKITLRSVDVGGREQSFSYVTRGEDDLDGLVLHTAATGDGYLKGSDLQSVRAQVRIEKVHG